MSGIDVPYFLLFQSVLNGMHVIFIPYALMKVNPASWLIMITKFKGMFMIQIFIINILSLKCYRFLFIWFLFFSSIASVAICKSRDLHWGLLATKDHKDVNLSSLRLLLIADGSNPCMYFLLCSEIKFIFCIFNYS